MKEILEAARQPIRHAVVLKHEAGEQQLLVPDGQLISEVLRQAGVTGISLPCGGRGVCGKCRVLVRRLADEQEMSVLACKTGIFEPLTIRLPNPAEMSIMEIGTALPFELEPLPVPAGREPGLGVAVDIGTTTVVVALFDRQSGLLLSRTSQENRQRSFGHDVISRIQYSVDAAQGLEEMTQVIRRQIAEMLEILHQQAGRGEIRVDWLTVAGNTVMLHLLSGLSPERIGVAPFTPLSHFGENWNGLSWLPLWAQTATAWLLPCISGYIGGDITAGILATGLWQAEGYWLLLDVGTNGEMVLGGKQGLFACATAAGPAFEGAVIEKGSSGVPGAIDHVWLEDGQLAFSTMDDQPPIGICGSGLIDAVAVALQLGLIDESGYLYRAEEVDDARRAYLGLEHDRPVFYLDPARTIWLSAKDIREVQLAKGAIAAGIDVLMAAAGIGTDQISRVFLAGGFGSFIRPEQACAIGLFPRELVDRVEAAGNTSISGASMALLSQRAQQNLKTIAERTQVIELSGDPLFMTRFIEKMGFEN